MTREDVWEKIVNNYDPGWYEDAVDVLKDFLEHLYENGFEVVDRKMSDAEIEKQMDESDTCFLDNELSEWDFNNDVAERNTEFDAIYSKKEE